MASKGKFIRILNKGCFLYEKGNPYGLVGTIIDITENKLAK
jgi:PAS domain-containing protein